MGITRVKNFNIAPYYDDFDETKNYHRIQFRPGHAVQARELTQLQTAFQSQLDKLGQYNFKDGSRVIGGKVTINTEYDFIKLTNASFTHSSTTYGTTYQSANLSSLIGSTITGTSNSGNQITALVLNAIAATGSEPNTLYIRYINAGGSDKTVEKFVADEVFVNDAGTALYGKVGASSVNPIGQGAVANIEEGAYFIAGTFVYVASQSLILDKYTNTPNYIIGLNVAETFDLDSASDSSLNDNAQGTPNFAAPGAHRYKINTTLIKESLTAPNTTYSNYILLMKVKDGVVQVETTDKTGGTELSSRLARRTHEESGDYAVRPYTLDIREHLDDEAGNGGYLTAANGGVATKLAVGVEPSVSYVKGHRIENLATKYVAVDKPREFVNENQQSVNLGLGNYVKVNTSGMNGLPDIGGTSGAYATASLKNSSAATIGTCRIRGVEKFTNSIYHVYLFDITMSGSNSFSSVTTITQSNASGQDFSATLTNTGVRYDTGNNGLVFKLPFSAVKSLLDSTPADPPRFVTRQRVQGTFSGNGTSATVSFNNFGGTLQSNSDILIAVGGNDPEVVDAGNVTTSVGATTLTIQNVAGTITGAADNVHAQVIFSVQKTSTGLKTKTKQTVSNQSFTYSSSTGHIPLDKADIKRVTAITIGGVDKLSDFTLDNGQRDNFYGEGKLIPIAGVVNGSTVVVSFEYYQHGNGDYFTVNSYDSSEYETIPTFNGIKGSVELRDAIDFRPTKATAGSFTADTVFTAGTGSQNADTPKPGSILLTDVSHYLPRVDKLFITREGEFKIVSGVADRNPKSPDDPNDAMVIYNLKFRPYIFGPSDLIPQTVENKRYTMRDIGSLDKRIKNLEYYTSLSLLEKEASSTQIFDGSNERLKNGFLVDGFYGHNVGNVSHPDYAVAIDKSNGILRPKFFEDNVNLIRHAAAPGTAVKNGSIVTLPFGHAEFAKQPYATTSEFVNPYNVFSWGGQVKLSPESDEWKDTEVRPDVIIDDEGVYDQLVFMAEESGVLGTVWNEWETNWTGTEVSTTTSGGGIITRAGNVNEFGGNDWWDGPRRGGGRIGFAGVTTTTATTTTSNQARSGLRTTVVPDTQLKELGSRVVETNFVPFIRSRKIFFKAELMKPNTKIFAFFNGSDVTNFCAEESYQEFSDQTNIVGYSGQTVHPSNTDLVTDGAGRCEGSFIIPRNSALKFKTGTREFRLTDSTTNDKDTESTFAEALYHAQGLLEVKENVIQSTKVPKFVTTELNDDRVITETNITSFTTPVTWVDPLAQTFIVDQVGGLFVTKLDLFVQSKDTNIPLNVSIRSVENGIPTQQIVPGTDVNVYPSSITTSTNGSSATTVTFDYPVYLGQDQEYCIVLISQSDEYKVFIAETGGFDLQNSDNRVTKQPYNGVFFTSQNASTWTPEQTKDLKFTLYRANFTSTSATLKLTNDGIPPRTLRTNPFTYLSASGGSSIIRVRHPNHGMYGANNKVTIAGQTGTVNGITAANINKTHDIIGASIELDSYAITVTGTASAVLIDGGGTGISATENNQYNTLIPQIQTLEVPGTAIGLTMEGQTGKSVDGAESAYSQVVVGGILANSNNDFNAPFTVASTINETTYVTSSAGDKSLVITANLAGTSTLSPVIDLNRCSVTTVSNRLNDATSNQAAYGSAANGRSYVADTAASGTSNANRYVTKRVDLNNEADILDVFINANKPSGSNIDLYFKVLAGGDDADFDNLSWIAASPESEIITNDGGGYGEVHYVIDPTIGKFGSFAFKIVLRSSNTSNVPTVKDFRAVAAT
jgi:hypothetical protein